MKKGVSVDAVFAAYPFLYHMAEAGAFKSILEHGLLSTSALLDLFHIEGARRDKIESSHRPESVVISHPEFGSVVIRDQKPMSDAGLRRALRDGIGPVEWYKMLNKKVFFWLTEDRLRRMMSARAYRNKRQTILILDSQKLVRDYASSIVLSPINSGCTKPMPHPRGKDTFQSLKDYPFSDWHDKRKGKDPIVELAVNDRVENVKKYLVRAEEVGGDRERETLWEA